MPYLITLRIKIIDLKEANVSKKYISKKSELPFFSVIFRNLPRCWLISRYEKLAKGKEKEPQFTGDVREKIPRIRTRQRKRRRRKERLVDRLRRFYEACTTITSNIVNLLLLLAVSRLSSSSTLSNNAS